MKPVDAQPSHILEKGTVLPHNYIIDKILGEGGFGITYSGTFTTTGEHVAIKEYFPTGLAHREYNNAQSYQVVPLYGMHDAFEKGRRHFLNEASILKEFQNLNSIVSVKDVIETNGTVYLVMEYIDGITIKQYVKENGALSFAELLPLMKPVIQALIQVHKKGLIHRDISPENLMVGIDNQLHLIDFGAASIENCHDDKTMTVILKSGYAPPEQYLSDGKQGAWTDIYALCATMYMTLTGFAPSESIRRIQNDDLPPLAEHADISSWQAAAIEKGMNLNAAERFQNMESLYQALIIPPIEMDSKRRDYQKQLEENKTIMKSNNSDKPSRKSWHKTILVTFLFVVFLMGALYFINTSPNANMQNNLGTTTETATATVMQNTTKHMTDTICTMIDFTGKTYEVAKNTISIMDNSIKIQTEWVYDDAPYNTVIAQSIKGGTDFTKGSVTSILLTISKGATPATEEKTEANTANNTTTTPQENSNNKSGSSKTTTSKKESNKKDTNYDVVPLDDDDDMSSFTID